MLIRPLMREHDEQVAVVTGGSQADTGPINICPTMKAVVIQAPSSKPAWTAPRTSARPKFVMTVERRYD
jgi:hypothetical protein